MNTIKKFRPPKILDERCEIHDCHLWLVEESESTQCPECVRESIINIERQLNDTAEVKRKLSDTYAMLGRDSILPEKLLAKSLRDYEIQHDIDQEAVNFAKRMERFYAKGGVGNAIITGPSGVGKSHLTYGMAQFMNEQFKSYDEPKSVLFVSVVRLFSLIKESFNRDNGYSEAKMVDLLTKVDFLFLDDLGKESRKMDRRSNEWAHRILYEILDNRSNTIINTNLSSEEIKAVYADDFGNGALSSRIFEGVTGHSFVYPAGMQDRRY